MRENSAVSVAIGERTPGSAGPLGEEHALGVELGTAGEDVGDTARQIAEGTARSPAHGAVFVLYDIEIDRSQPDAAHHWSARPRCSHAAGVYLGTLALPDARTCPSDVAASKQSRLL